MLIKCPECNHDISDTATTCPNCGYNIQENIEEIRAKIDMQANLDEERRVKDEEQRKRFFAWLKKRWILVTLGALVLVFGGIVIYNVVKILKYGFEDCKTAWLLRNEYNSGIKNDDYYSDGGDIIHFTMSLPIEFDSDETETFDIYAIPTQVSYNLNIIKFDSTGNIIWCQYICEYHFDIDHDRYLFLLCLENEDIFDKIRYRVYDKFNNYYTNDEDLDNLEVISENEYDSILIHYLPFYNSEVKELHSMDDFLKK